MNTIDNLKKCKTRSSCVKFSENEFIEIKKAQVTTGESIPTLLKNAFFQNSLKLRTPMFSDVEARKITNQIARLGNNINQIARKVNSGLAKGWSQEIREVIQELKIIRQFLLGQYGIRQN